jgi:4-amino-4-deoxy-L-arabinose transferase-like glycosyltransferase
VRRVRRRLALVPTSLRALLAAVAVVVIAWSLFTPPFHVPDEGGHFAYVQSVADDQRRPVFGEFFAPEEQVAEEIARGRSIVEQPRSKPAWTSAAERRFAVERRAVAHIPPLEPLASTQERDPPLYYAYEAIPYRLTGGTFFDRLFAMRLWSAALLLLATTFAWLLAGELFGRDRLLQLVAAACVGLQPMVTFMSGGVNQDSASFATTALVLWLGVRMIRRGPSGRGLAALAAALLAAALVKTVLLSLLPAAAIAVLVSYRRSGARLPRWGAAAAAAAVVVAGLVASGSLADRVPAVADLDGFASYLWQYYLPRLPFQDPIEGLGTFKAWIWLTGSWARFGWLEIRFPYPVYAVLGAISLGTFAAAALAIWRGRVPGDRAVIAFFAAALVCLLIPLHLADYAALADTGAPINQGRYILPLLPIAGVALAAALTNLPARRRAQGASVLLGGMVALQLFSLAIVAGRFYV